MPNAEDASLCNYRLRTPMYHSISITVNKHKSIPYAERVSKPDAVLKSNAQTKCRGISWVLQEAVKRRWLGKA
jgi:hypothetical protein